MILRPTLPRVPIARLFSTSSTNYGKISHVGKRAIPFPATVSFTPTPSELSIQGPLGTTAVPLHPFLQLNFEQPQTLKVSVENSDLKKQRAIWGLTRSLIHNAIIGITEGYTTPVYLVGVGYRAALEPDPRGVLPGFTGQRLNMKLGFSHPVYVPVPDYAKVVVESPTKIVVSCTDKHKLGLFAAKVRSWRPPEPYKGKGIFVGNERVRMKAVKKK